MAKKKTKKNTKNTAKKDNPKHKEKQPKERIVSRRVKNSIIAVILFGLSALMVLGYFSAAGDIGSSLVNGASFLFGSGSVLVPIGFFIGALAILRTLKRPSIPILIGIVIFIFAGLGFIEVATSADKAGGIIGFWIAKPFVAYLDQLGSAVVFGVLIITAILLGLNLSLVKRDKKKQEKLEGAVLLGQSDQDEKPTKEKKKAPAGLFGLGTKGGFTKRPITTLSDLSGKKKAAATKSSPKMSGFELEEGYEYPPLDYLHKSAKQDVSISEKEIQTNVKNIKATLDNFGIDVTMGEVNVGPTVTQYTLKPSSGIKLSQIVALQNDLALALAAHPLRIEAPIPGKSAVGIEVPNKKLASVRLRDLIELPEYKKVQSNLSFVLGKDVSGKPTFDSLERMPHLLIAGTTGSGKSVAVHNIITTFLYQNSPKSLRFIMIDPKRVELSMYEGIPHLLGNVIVDHHKAIGALKWTVNEMDRRYGLLSEIGAQDIYSFNEELLRIKQKAKGAEDESSRRFLEMETLPLLVVVVDELADLMVKHGREVEQAVIRLAQMARAVGVHLILSTQRPSVDVVTGLIKANIIYRIAFKVSSQVDSRTILDMAGAEKLLGKGDMLYLSGDSGKPRRIQGVMVASSEVRKVAKFLKDLHIKHKEESLEFEEKTVNFGDFSKPTHEDELYEDAKKVVMQAKKASASLLQRRLSIGYARAARILDSLEERGVVGPQEGSRPREVLIQDED